MTTMRTPWVVRNPSFVAATCFGAFLVSAAGSFAAEPATAIARADLDFFESRIRPVLVQNCYECHSREADKVRGGLLLDSQQGLLQGGLSGAAIVPGRPDESLLIEAISYRNPDLQMPPKDRKLSDEAIVDLIEWVRRGAPVPRTPATASGGGNYGGVGKNHWAFQPVRKPAVPAVQNATWAQNEIDRFILAKLETAGMTPNPPADKRTLLRRATFDLIGLPPTEAEVEAFLADDSPEAFARVVDRLLASPQYGEHWARYWLDVARYSDTKGDPRNREDPRYPHAWTYRDYVIDAFNRDKPYNEFIMEQLAADRLVAVAMRRTRAERPTVEQQQSLAALGFLTVGNAFNGRRNDVIDDQIDVTTKAFLGLTVSCARCHDHKFDPIPTADYYSLFGIFANSTVPPELPVVGVPQDPSQFADYQARLAELTAKATELQAQLRPPRRDGRNRRQLLRETMPQARRQPLTREQRRELVLQLAQIQRQLGDLESNHPGAPARAMVVNDVPNPRDWPILLRGEVGNTGDVVPRRAPEILAGLNRRNFKNGSGRLELAQFIASPDNPMTARVIVNRVWQQHFGSGFVNTPDDLGNMSAPPTHPELLDWLAVSFVEQGWSLKQLHRKIVLSSAYQLSSAANAQHAQIDPDNKLYWRANLRRLDFEQLHDALLAMAGSLDLSKIGGKPISIGSVDFTMRRAIYTLIDRRNPPELLTQFDFPNPNTPSGRRHETIVPQQALFLMNSPLVIETARKLTHRSEFEQLSSDEQRVTSLYHAIFQRPPTADEQRLCLAFVHSTPGGATLEAPEQTLFSQANARGARRQQQLAERMAQMGGAVRGNFQPEPGGAAFPTRDPLDAWTKLAHALFQTNEAMFLN